MMKNQIIFCIAVALVATFASSAQALSVKSATAAGSACKADQGIKVDANNNAIIVTFPDLSSEKNSGKRLARDHCNASINLQSEDGQRFRPVRVHLDHTLTSGNADDLNLRANVWFQANKDTAGAELKLIPTTKSSVANLSPEIWSPCSKDVTLNAGVALVAKSKAGLSKDIKVAFKDGVKIEIETKPCATKEN